jgi:hypothetical protein
MFYEMFNLLNVVLCLASLAGILYTRWRRPTERESMTAVVYSGLAAAPSALIAAEQVYREIARASGPLLVQRSGVGLLGVIGILFVSLFLWGASFVIVPCASGSGSLRFIRLIHVSTWAVAVTNLGLGVLYI